MGMHGFRGVHRFGRRVTTGGAAPVISSVVATPQEYYTTVTWTTDVASSSQVEYGNDIILWKFDDSGCDA
jgi:hypothetical protein